MNSFISFTNELNDYAKNYTGEREIIGKEEIILAKYYINNLYIENEIDVLIFLSAMNLYNAYIKQNKYTITYSFKKNIGTLIKTINECQFNDIKICESIDLGHTYIFTIGNIQFSFHDEKRIEIDNRYIQDIKWDAIKKQPCAKTLFLRIINNDEAKLSLTTTGENIYEKSNELLENYKQNKVSFEDIINN